jgi:uncharacterized protein (TIGR02145 family)
MNNKIWHDPKTGLDWEIKTLGNRRMEYSIDDAIEYVLGLNSDKFGGFDDWRLPSLDELITICSVEPYRYNKDYKEWRIWLERSKDKANNGFFIVPELSDNVGKDGWYWSSTPKSETEYYLLNFKEGNTNYHDRNQTFYVRCVRG